MSSLSWRVRVLYDTVLVLLEWASTSACRIQYRLTRRMASSRKDALSDVFEYLERPLGQSELDGISCASQKATKS